MYQNIPAMPLKMAVSHRMTNTVLIFFKGVSISEPVILTY